MASAAIRLTSRPTNGSNFKVTKIAADADQHDRQPERPDVPAEERLREEENVEMQRPVIIGRVVSVETVLHHLIDEPAVDPFVEMRRFYAEKEKPEERARARRSPRTSSRSARARSAESIGDGVGISARAASSPLLGSAAMRILGDGRLWIHREQLYSLHSGTLQAGVQSPMSMS